MQNSILNSDKKSQRSQKKFINNQRQFELNKINSKINILCIGESTCDFNQFLKIYTSVQLYLYSSSAKNSHKNYSSIRQQKYIKRLQQDYHKNEIENIYIKKFPYNNLKQQFSSNLKYEQPRVIFLHECKYRQQQLYIFQQFDGLIFFVDIVHNLNNTKQNILKYLQKLSSQNGVNIFTIPIKLIVLNGNKLSHQQYIDHIDRLNNNISQIVTQDHIIYVPQFTYQILQNTNQKLYCFFMNIFQNGNQNITSSYMNICNIYGINTIIQSNWIQIKIILFGFIQKSKKIIQSLNPKLKNAYYFIDKVKEHYKNQ